MRFCTEVAKAMGKGQCKFYDQDVFDRQLSYGSMRALRGNGR